MIQALVATVISGIFAVAVAYLSYAWNRQVNFGIAQERLQKYAKLWAAMKVTSPMDHKLARREPLGATDRDALYACMTDWYFDHQGGLVLTTATRNIFLAVKENLVCDPEAFVPKSQRQLVADDAERSKILLRQFSLLRTRMKADLAIYSMPLSDKLKSTDMHFLREAGDQVDRPPWSRRIWQFTPPRPAVEGDA